MCLAIPGRVVRWLEREPPFCEAEVEFLGIQRRCNLSCVPEVEEGDYVLVHAGVAIQVLDQQAAMQILDELGRTEIEQELSGGEL